LYVTLYILHLLQYFNDFQSEIIVFGLKSIEIFIRQYLDKILKIEKFKIILYNIYIKNVRIAIIFDDLVF